MKYILITGAAGGMGDAVVKLFASLGYTVFALDRKEVGMRENVIPLVADVTDEESLRAAFDEVVSVTRELYAVIDLAGIYMLDSLAEMEREKFERAFAVNVEGAFLVNRTFLPLLKEGSRIVIVTSELAVREPLPFTGIYGITKTALDKYAYSLRMELQLIGIGVSVLRAGAVGTGLLDDSVRQLDRFCETTKLYKCNADRFRRIVGRVEARCVPPEVIAKKIGRLVGKRRPAFSYSVNRNPLLILFDKLPERLRFFVIRKILK